MLSGTQTTMTMLPRNKVIRGEFDHKNSPYSSGKRFIEFPAIQRNTSAPGQRDKTSGPRRNMN